MKFFTQLFAIGLLASLAQPLSAADLPAGKVYYSAAGYCHVIHPSPILSLPSVNDIEDAVAQHLNTSVAAADDPAVIFNRGVAYIWANETKASCGKAAGYLAGQEVNVDEIDKCDCFYNRMVSFLYRHR